MTPEELDAIEARAKAVYLGSTGLGYAEAAEARPVVEADVPALVAEVRRLRAEVEGLRTAVLRVGVARDAARIAAGAHTLAHNALVERHRSGAPAEALEPLAHSSSCRTQPA